MKKLLITLLTTAMLIAAFEAHAGKGGYFAGGFLTGAATNEILRSGSKQSYIRDLERENDSLRREIERLERKIDRLER